ncbi:MAG: ATP synthase F1 subunit epsilon [Bdellovibrio sp. 28-41-41]|nr:MAG: ATP synthase F1 subunit epsilon [Bdellovibrio sp. 28-41-41]
MKMTLVTPEKRILTGADVESVTVPAFRGELNILEGHTPLVTTLDTGIMRWKVKGSDRFQYAVISWGYCEVYPNGIDILAETADLPEDVNLTDAQSFIDKAKARLAAESLNDADYADLSRVVKRGESSIEVTKFKN